MVSEPANILTWTVVTIDGAETTHTYDVPLSPKEARQLVDSFATIFLDALNGTLPALTLVNPTVTYNPAHIVRVNFNSYGQIELDKILADAQRPMGFQFASAG
ncbi:MAG: hypothetical protein O2913_12720 [Chloroflexi bacterium]|nr:hypothetical protein [Chloroflexota bacterium]